MRTQPFITTAPQSVGDMGFKVRFNVTDWGDNYPFVHYEFYGACSETGYKSHYYGIDCSKNRDVVRHKEKFIKDGLILAEELYKETVKTVRKNHKQNYLIELKRLSGKAYPKVNFNIEQLIAVGIV